MTSKANGVIMDPRVVLPRRSSVRGYFENRGWCILVWLLLVALWFGFEWLANLFSLNRWAVEIVGFFVAGYLIYRFLFKGSPSEMKPSTKVDVEPYKEWVEKSEDSWDERKRVIDEKFCPHCGSLKSVRVTKDHKIVIYCSRCDAQVGRIT